VIIGGSITSTALVYALRIAAVIADVSGGRANPDLSSRHPTFGVRDDPRTEDTCDGG
jgi:hypothetical protein